MAQCFAFFQRTTSEKTLWKRAGLGAVGVVAGAILTFQIAQYKLRTSVFNRLALDELTKHSKVMTLIGEPIAAGNVFSRTRGSIKRNDVDCVVPIFGQNSDGLIKYQADKHDGEWVLRRMEFTFIDDKGGAIRLVKKKESSTDVKEDSVVDVNKS